MSETPGNVALVRVGLQGKPRHQLAFAGLVAMMYMSLIGLHPFTERMAAAADDKGGGDLPRQLWYTAILLVAVWSNKSIRYPRRLLILPAPLVAALLWCLLSVTWSIAPGIALRRLVLTVMVLFAIFRLVDQLGPDRSVAAVRTLLLGVLVLNYVAMVVSPVAIHRTTEVAETNLVGAWRGALAHKNFAGPVCAATVIAFAFDNRRVALWLRALVILAASYFLYRTQSKTSLGLMVMALAVGAAYLRYNRRYRILLLPALAVIGSVAVLMLVVNWDALWVQLNDPTAFTGRAQIWPPMIRFIGEHKEFGAGFGSFWNIGTVNPISTYAKGWVTLLGNGHNGYLDLATQIGLPGLALVVFAVTVHPISRLMLFPVSDRSKGALVLALLVFCFGHNFTETSLLDRDAIVEVFLMIAIALSYQVTQSSNPIGSVRIPPRPPLRRAVRSMRPAQIGIKR